MSKYVKDSTGQTQYWYAPAQNTSYIYRLQVLPEAESSASKKFFIQWERATYIVEPDDTIRKSDFESWDPAPHALSFYTSDGTCMHWKKSSDLASGLWFSKKPGEATWTLLKIHVSSDEIEKTRYTLQVATDSKFPEEKRDLSDYKINEEELTGIKKISDTLKKIEEKAPYEFLLSYAKLKKHPYLTSILHAAEKVNKEDHRDKALEVQKIIEATKKEIRDTIAQLKDFLAKGDNASQRKKPKHLKETINYLLDEKIDLPEKIEDPNAIKNKIQISVAIEQFLIENIFLEEPLEENTFIKNIKIFFESEQLEKENLFLLTCMIKEIGINGDFFTENKEAITKWIEKIEQLIKNSKTEELDNLIQNGKKNPILLMLVSAIASNQEKTNIYDSLKGLFEKVVHEENAANTDQVKKDSLFLAAQAGLTEIFDCLLEKNLDINSPNDNGDTVWHFASENPNDHFLKKLRAQKSQTDEKSAMNLENKNKKTPLLLAIKKGHKSHIKLLIEAGAKPSLEERDQWEKEDEKLLMSIAIENFYWDIIITFFNLGIKIDKLDALKSVLNQKDKYLEFAKILLDLDKENAKKIIGALVSENILEPENHGLTLLCLAAEKGQLEVAEVLLEAGVNPLGKDGKTNKALELAKTNNHARLIDLLERYARTAKNPKKPPPVDPSKMLPSEPPKSGLAQETIHQSPHTDVQSQSDPDQENRLSRLNKTRHILCYFTAATSLTHIARCAFFNIHVLAAPGLIFTAIPFTLLILLQIYKMAAKHKAAAKDAPFPKEEHSPLRP